MATETLDMRKVRDATRDAVPPAQKPLVGPRVDINVEYTDPTGQRHEGKLVARVPESPDDRARIGRVQAALAGTRPFDDMPSTWRNWAEAYARCSILIVDLPEWFAKWAPVDDILLYSVANVMLVHEDTFFRPGAAAGTDTPPQRILVSAPELVAAGVLSA